MIQTSHQEGTLLSAVGNRKPLTQLAGKRKFISPNKRCRGRRLRICLFACSKCHQGHRLPPCSSLIREHPAQHPICHSCLESHYHLFVLFFRSTPQLDGQLPQALNLHLQRKNSQVLGQGGGGVPIWDARIRRPRELRQFSSQGWYWPGCPWVPHTNQAREVGPLGGTLSTLAPSTICYFVLI